jgi:SAM-dependent methyltransferase
MSSIVLDRTHDKEIYLQENRYREPKECFKRLAALLRSSGVVRPGSAIADFGCATGEFLYYLTTQFPEATMHGFDVVPEFIESGKRAVPQARFRQGSVLDPNSAAPHSFDATFLVGVHSIFDEFQTCFSNLLRWTKPGGRVYVFGQFNPHPIDVWVKYRRCDDPFVEHREPGWNIFSMESISQFLNATACVQQHAFHAFEMPFDLPPHQDDPVRTYTLTLETGRRILVNGLMLISDQSILEIQLIGPGK